MKLLMKATSWLGILGAFAATMWAASAHASVFSDTSQPSGVKTDVAETAV